MIRRIAAVILLAQAYAIVRYAVFKGVPLDHWPLYLNNKAISLAGLVLLGVGYAMRRGTGENGAASNGHSPGALIAQAGFALIGLHVLLSLPILSPGYFPQFFTDDKMNLAGELSMLLGVLSFGGCLAMASVGGAASSSPANRQRLRQRISVTVLLTAAGHVLVMGASGWLTPGQWPGGLPPITLLAFLAAVIPLLLRMRRNQRRG